MRSSAIYRGFAVTSAIIPNSVGPASISIAVLSLTIDLAIVTNAPPGPTILSTLDIDFVPNDNAAIA